MRTPEGKLEKDIYARLMDINKNKDYIKRISDILKSKNILTATGILNKRIPLETLSRAELFAVTDAIYKVTNDENINPDAYFKDMEITEYSKYKKEINTITFPIEIDINYLISEDHHVSYTKATRIAEFYNNHLITYNPDTQRDTKKIHQGDDIIEVIDYNPKSVDEIAAKMIEDDFILNYITINIRMDGEEDFKYDRERNKLIIYKANLDIIDGFHRSLAMVMATTSDPKLKYKTGVNWVYWNEDKCKRFIKQENTINLMSEEYKKKIDPDNLVNQVVKQINEKSDSMLQKKIKTDLTPGELNKSLVLSWNTIYNSIQNNFTIKDKLDVRNISNFLIEGLNEIIFMFDKEFKEFKTSREFNVITDNNMFAGYIIILGEIYKNFNGKLDKDKLETILCNIDYSKDNLELKNIGIAKRLDLNKKEYEKIQKHFQNMMKGGVV